MIFYSAMKNNNYYEASTKLHTTHTRSKSTHSGETGFPRLRCPEYFVRILRTAAYTKFGVRLRVWDKESGPWVFPKFHSRAARNQKKKQQHDDIYLHYVSSTNILSIYSVYVFLSFLSVIFTLSPTSFKLCATSKGGDEL